MDQIYHAMLVSDICVSSACTDHPHGDPDGVRGSDGSGDGARNAPDKRFEARAGI
jgi:hypothetical protein